MDKDNTTPHAAADYEREIERTIPFHARILQEAVDAALSVRPSPSRWLDTGCGPGRLAEIVAARCNAELTLADPSSAMLAIARAKHPSIPAQRFLPMRSEDLTAKGWFDVVTAIQCHHYGDAAARAMAVARCFDALVPGGVFVVFENVRAEKDAWQSVSRQRWATWQRAHGRDEQAVLEHLAREGTKFFPIRVSEHLGLLSRTGFAVVELLWRTYAQAGFVCIKAGSS
jgi:tRNA (cmo5U34)-methyltransferase